MYCCENKNLVLKDKIFHPIYDYTTLFKCLNCNSYFFTPPPGIILLKKIFLKNIQKNQAIVLFSKIIPEDLIFFQEVFLLIIQGLKLLENI